jgi:hypothetical protein
MDKFVASNGVTVDTDVHGCVTVAGVESLRDSSQALREFFQHERDQELGRWRWPENPDYVVVQADNGGERAWVVNERNQQITGWVWRADLDRSTARAQVVAAARAYFDAHPEPKPIPTEPGSVLQGTGPNRTILHRSYPVNGRESDHPWTALGGATYADEEVPEFFHGQFVHLVPKEDS